MDIGKYFQKLRLDNQWTQEELATMLNMSRQAVSHYERNERDINLELLAKLCVIFDITADEVLEIETKEQREKILKDLKKGKQ